MTFRLIQGATLAEIHANARDDQMADDREWFAANPDETERYRDPWPHEFCDPRYDHLDDCRPLALPRAVLVRQIAPGFRTRLPVVEVTP